MNGESAQLPPRRWTPPAAIRMPWWLFTIDFAAAVLSFVTAMYGNGSFLSFLLCIGVLVLAAAASTLIMWRRDRTVRDLLDAHADQLCLRCAYPLSGLGQSGLCPECREPYECASNARIWRAWRQSHNQRRQSANQSRSTT